MELNITHLWRTPFWLGQFDYASDVRKLTDIPSGNAPQDITELRTAARLLTEIEGVAAAVAGPDADSLAWTHYIQRWQPGHQLGYGYQHAVVWALAIIDSTPPPDQPLSGEIRLHDPRSGVANVGLPGLPWGRPVTFPAVTGALVALPGWLPVSIAPVRPGHVITAVTIFGQHSTRPDAPGKIHVGIAPRRANR